MLVLSCVFSIFLIAVLTFNTTKNVPNFVFEPHFGVHWMLGSLYIIFILINYYDKTIVLMSFVSSVIFFIYTFVIELMMEYNEQYVIDNEWKVYNPLEKY